MIENQITADEARAIYEGKHEDYYKDDLIKIFDKIKDASIKGYKSTEYSRKDKSRIPIGIINYLKQLGYRTDYLEYNTGNIYIDW